MPRPSAAVIDLTLERHRDLLKRGAVLVDERDPGASPRLLCYLEHAIQDASLTPGGERRVISGRMLYVELGQGDAARHLHYAPYLDYRPLAEDDPGLDAILDHPECAWLDGDLESRAQRYAVADVVPQHLQEVRAARLTLIAKTEVAVKERLTREINTWDHRAEQLKLQEQAGQSGARLNSLEARRRADHLQARLRKRLEELTREAQLSPLPPPARRRARRAARAVAAMPGDRARRLDGGHPGRRGPCARDRYGGRTAARL